MKTGFDLVIDNNENNSQIEFMRKSVSMMNILAEEALETSVRFAKCCGRNVVQPQDMHYALMYEAHEFFEKDIDSRFFQNLEQEQTHTYDTEEEDDEEDEEKQPEETIEEEYTDKLMLKEEEEFHQKVLDYAKNWDNWFPDDSVKQLIKQSIDKTRLSD
jgi:hypothetical protein